MRSTRGNTYKCSTRRPRLGNDLTLLVQSENVRSTRGSTYKCSTRRPRLGNDPYLFNLRLGGWGGVSRSIEKHVFAPTKCISTANRVDKTRCFRKRAQQKPRVSSFKMVVDTHFVETKSPSIFTSALLRKVDENLMFLRLLARQAVRMRKNQ